MQSAMDNVSRNFADSMHDTLTSHEALQVAEAELECVNVALGQLDDLDRLEQEAQARNAFDVDAISVSSNDSLIVAQSESD